MKPSNAGNPDLDWSQVRETVLMLNVAVSQIVHAMRDGDESVTELAKLFTSMVGNVQAIGKAAANLSQENEKSLIRNKVEDISGKVDAAIVTFQFYDQLAQRLSHVCDSLASLAELINDSKRLYSPYEWHDLQQMIKGRYTSMEDRAMFDAVLDGASIDEALRIVDRFKQEKKKGADDVELF